MIPTVYAPPCSDDTARMTSGSSSEASSTSEIEPRDRAAVAGLELGDELIGVDLGGHTVMIAVAATRSPQQSARSGGCGRTNP